MASPPGSPKSPKEGGDKPKAFDIGELMVRIDESVEKAIEDTQALFVTNVREQRSVLSEARDCINKLVQENGAIQEMFVKREQEGFALQEVQTEDIFQKKCMIESLEAQLVQKDVDIAKLHEDYRIEIRKIGDEGKVNRKQLTDNFTKQIEELQRQLNSVLDFQKRQDEVEARMEAAEKEAAELRQKMADLAPGYERKLMETSTKIKDDLEKKHEEFMQKVNEEIAERIGDRVREVIGQNEILLSEIHMHSTGTSELQAEKDRLTAENTKLRCELQLVRQAVELHVKRSRHQSHVIRHNDNKIQNLEKSLRQVIRQYSEERRILQEKHNYVLAELNSDNQKLKGMVLQKAKELKKFRHLAQVVIRQRGEVELFLLDSIQLVKNQIYLQNRVRRSQTPDNEVGRSTSNASLKSGDRNPSTTLPPINSKSPASWPGASPWPPHSTLPGDDSRHSGRERTESGKEFPEDHSDDEGASQLNASLDELQDPTLVPHVLPMIDISELSWPEREKVLRYLFKKINMAHQAGPTKLQGYKSDAGRTIV